LISCNNIPFPVGIYPICILGVVLPNMTIYVDLFSFSIHVLHNPFQQMTLLIHLHAYRHISFRRISWCQRNSMPSDSTLKFTGDSYRINPLKSRGYFTYHHTAFICVLYGCQKQQILPHITWVVFFTAEGENVPCAVPNETLDKTD
jgi:hypothetical protein